jgi:2,4'-dihydroxyacetophenone dioxygenase
MTMTIEPTTATTSSGAPLPLVALPQGAAEHQRERHPADHRLAGTRRPCQAAALDLEAGCWVVLATFSPGAVVPVALPHRRS